MTLTQYALIAALLAAGVQTTRLAMTERDHAETEAAWAIERAALSDAKYVAQDRARKVEQELAKTNEENAREQARLKADAARRVADAQRVAAGLRDTIATLSRRDRPADPVAAGWFDAATTARGLVGECSDRRTEVAEAADSLRTQVIGLQAYVSGVCAKSGP